MNKWTLHREVCNCWIAKPLFQKEIPSLPHLPLTLPVALLHGGYQLSGKLCLRWGGKWEEKSKSEKRPLTYVVIPRALAYIMWHSSLHACCRVCLCVERARLHVWECRGNNLLCHLLPIWSYTYDVQSFFCHVFILQGIELYKQGYLV